MAQLLQNYKAPDEWFNQWWDPQRLFKIISDSRGMFSDLEFMSSARLKPLREGWVAAKFSLILGQDRVVKVRLVRDSFPDFEIQVRGEVKGFELTDAERPGRRRSLEYKELEKADAAELKLDEFDPDEEEKIAIIAVERAIKRKAGKKYQPRPNLLIYANFLLFDDKPPQNSEFGRLIAVASEYESSFLETWLLWGSVIVRLNPSPAFIRDRTDRSS